MRYDQSRGPGDGVRFGGFEGGKLVAEAVGLVEWMALEGLAWRCARCRRSGRQHIHHRRYRSHGGTHRVDNLEAVCWKCYRLIHQCERSQ